MVGERSNVSAPTHVPPHPGAERDKLVAAPPRGERGQLLEHATNIARAAKRLNDLRERWLNPPEWTQRVPEVIPLGMDCSKKPLPV